GVAPDAVSDDGTGSKWPRSNCSSAVRVMRASVDFRLWSDAGFYRWWMEPPSADGPPARLPRQQPGCFLQPGCCLGSRAARQTGSFVYLGGGRADPDQFNADALLLRPRVMADVTGRGLKFEPRVGQLDERHRRNLAHLFDDLRRPTGQHQGRRFRVPPHRPGAGAVVCRGPVPGPLVGPVRPHHEPPVTPDTPFPRPDNRLVQRCE